MMSEADAYRRQRAMNDARYALWAAQQVRKYTPYGRTIQNGITPLHHKAAAMYPEYDSPERVRAQYFGLLRRAANRRRLLLLLDEKARHGVTL